MLKHVFIYVPSYFDYVRLRNAIKEDAEEPSVALICEYVNISKKHNWLLKPVLTPTSFFKKIFFEQ